MTSGHIAPSLHRRRIFANATLAGALLACISIAAFPPARYHFYPLCPVYQYLGLLCPACGATRALAALLRGHFVEALHLNMLFVLLLPFALFGLSRLYLRAVRSGEFRWPSVPAPALTATLVAATAFAIARNLHGLSF